MDKFRQLAMKAKDDASINRELRESLLSQSSKRRFRVYMLNKSQQKLRESIEKNLHVKKTCKSIIREGKQICPKVECSRTCTTNVLHEIFPFIRIMRRYSIRRNLLHDLVAGLTVGIMHIPQGMAYGFLTQLPPIYGLYTSFFPVLLYFFFGSSKHVSVGTFAVVSLMVGQVVNRGFLQEHGKMSQEMTNRTTLVNTSAGLMRVPVTPPVDTINSHGSDSGHADPIKLGYALSVTIVVGVFQLMLGALRLGSLATFMSDPFISGFTTGAAVHVFSSQIKHLFGVKVHHHHGPLALVYFYAEFFTVIQSTNMVTLTASITCIFTLVMIKEGINNNQSCKKDLLMPVPIELIVISVSCLVSYYTKLNTEFGVTTVGSIPSGLPSPTVEHLKYIPNVLGDGLTIGFIAFAISFSMAKILADKHGYRVNANQELVALGVCNTVSSFFSSYCCAASLSRSLVQDTAGGKTQELVAFGVSNVIGAMFQASVCSASFSDSLIQESCGSKTQVVGIISSMVVLVVLLYIGPMFQSLPECILASIVIVTLKGMFLQFGELKRLWRLSKKDFAVCLVTFIAVVVLDVALGLLIGIVFSLYFVLRHSQKPQMSQLGQVPGTGAYKDTKSAANLNEIKGMKIFRFETSIYFANAEHFRDKLYDKTGLIPRKLKKKKRRAMHVTLLRRKRELEQAELERKKELEKSQANRYAIEVVVKRPEEEYEKKERASRENKLVLERFAKAWQPPIKVLIIDLSVVNYVDTVAVKVLSGIVNDYKEVGIKVFLAGCKPDVREMLKLADFYTMVDYNSIYFTVHEAVVIGQEILDEEKKKKSPNPIDVKLYHKMSEGAPQTEQEEEEESHEEDEEEEEEEEEEEGKMEEEIESEIDDSDEEDNDSEQYDTSPEDTEETMITPGAVSFLQTPTSATTYSTNLSTPGTSGASAVPKKGVTFELMPLEDKSH